MSAKRDSLIKKAENARRESKYIDFKEGFDSASKREWCKLVKHIVAMANSGGGLIIFGLGNGGKPSGEDLSSINSVDPSHITNKVKKYTDIEFDSFEFCQVVRNGASYPALLVEGVSIPMIFTCPGTYPVDAKKQANEFVQGTMYFRHGAKSETGNSNDIRACIERELQRIRKSWLGDIKKITQAPAGHEVHVMPAGVHLSTAPDATPIRITDDPGAPAFRQVDTDTAFPIRQRELLGEVNSRLPDDIAINPFDVLCVRKVHELDKNENMQYATKFGSRQYSRACAEWLLEQFNQNSNFFKKARRDYRAQQDK